MITKKPLLILLLCLAPLSQALAQEAPKTEPMLREINRDIWLPFADAYATGNAEKYLKLHSRDFIRGEGDRKRVLNLTQYSEGVRRSFQQWKERGGKVDIQFRFLERMASDQAASERGIYQLSFTPTEGEARKFYGKFHVFSRKEEGVWKILVDYDSEEGGTIDEKSFQAAFALDDFAKY